MPTRKYPGTPRGTSDLAEVYLPSPRVQLRQQLELKRLDALPKVMDRLIEEALKGDFNCIKFLLERELPKDAPLLYDLPKITSITKAREALQQIADDVCKARLTPTEADILDKIITNIVVAIEREEMAFLKEGDSPKGGVTNG